MAKPALPRAPAVTVPAGISADAMARRIDEFLGSRGYVPPKGGSYRDGGSSHTESGEKADAPTKSAGPSLEEKPTDFVCEDDVRQAMRQGRKIVIGERTIVTPAARDMGEQHRVFVQAAWPR